ncbi:MAG: hypothetical protein ACREM1_21325 [Longimicrobiales bacterium]
MMLRRAVGLLLLLTVAVSSAEVLLAPDELPVVTSEVAASPMYVVLDASAPEDGSIPEDCACLCACGCVNAQVVVLLEPVEFCATGVELTGAVVISAAFARRARARPHLRPPLA